MMATDNLFFKKHYRLGYCFITLLTTAILSVSCSDNPTSDKPQPEPEPEPNQELMGGVEVTTKTNGLDPNPGGYVIDISDVENFQIAANATIKSEEIEEGTYSVELREVDNHCTVQSENPVTVDVVAAETASVQFEVECKGIFRNSIVFFRSASRGAFKKTRNPARGFLVAQNYYTMNPDGSEIQKAADLTLDGSIHFLSDISPDGTKIAIAYAGNRNGSRSNFRIAIVDAYDNRIRYLTDESEDTHYFHPVFSPDGKQIAFTGYSDRGLFGDIYVMDADGSDVTKVTNTEDLDEQPNWSPDGKQLIFQRTSDEYQYVGIFAINIDGSGERLINQSGLELKSPQWSPDGGQILAVGSQIDQEGYTYTEVYVMNSDGSNVRAVASKQGKGVYHSTPGWSPAGDYIIFSSNRSGEPDEEFGYSYEPYDLFRVNSDGSDLMNLTNSSQISESNVMWSPVHN